MFSENHAVELLRSKMVVLCCEKLVSHLCEIQQDCFSKPLKNMVQLTNWLIAIPAAPLIKLNKKNEKDITRPWKPETENYMTSRKSFSINVDLLQCTSLMSVIRALIAAMSEVMHWRVLKQSCRCITEGSIQDVAAQSKTGGRHSAKKNVPSLQALFCSLTFWFKCPNIILAKKIILLRLPTKWPCPQRQQTKNKFTSSAAGPLHRQWKHSTPRSVKTFHFSSSTRAERIPLHQRSKHASV